MDYPNPHPEGCYWHSWAEQLGAPNIKWCEPTVCGFISEPANTWSNLAYLVVAGICFAVWLRNRNPTARWIAPAIFIMGAGSFIYHMSNNRVTQLVDFIGMFFWIFLLVAIDVRRFGWLARRGAQLLYWLLVIGASFGIWGLYAIGFPFQSVIGILAGVLIVMEIWLRLRAGPGKFSMRWFFIALGLLGVAEAFSLMDINRIWCNPENAFLHGHVLWHLIGSLGVGAAFLHFVQFRLDEPEPV